ncbi:MAG: hypothetical protein O3A02_04825 [bacterium]|nr:hypothetical protein [bacterium]
MGFRIARPLVATTAQLRRGLREIRSDTAAPATVVRRELAMVRATAPVEIGAQLESVERALAIVEERQLRETAWLAATIHDQRAPLIGWANLLGTSLNVDGSGRSSLLPWLFTAAQGTRKAPR